MNLGFDEARQRHERRIAYAIEPSANPDTALRTDRSFWRAAGNLLSTDLSNRGSCAPAHTAEL